MSNFAIVSQMKIKAKDMWNGISAHNKRESSPKNVKREHTHKNITLIRNPYKDFSAFVEQHRKRIREHNQKHGTKNRMLRKNTKGKHKGEFKSMSQELVFTYSHDALTEQEGIYYLEMALRFVKEELYPDQEVFSAEIHLDEETPHIHLDVSFFNTKQNKFVQAELQKRGLTDINYIRSQWQKKVEETGFELKKQDGSVVGVHDGAKADKEKGELKKALCRQEVEIHKAEEKARKLHRKNINLFNKAKEIIGKKDNEIEKLKNKPAKKIKVEKVVEKQIPTSILDKLRNLDNKIKQEATEFIQSLLIVEHHALTIKTDMPPDEEEQEHIPSDMTKTVYYATNRSLNLGK